MNNRPWTGARPPVVAAIQKAENWPRRGWRPARTRWSSTPRTSPYTWWSSRTASPDSPPSASTCSTSPATSSTSAPSPHWSGAASARSWTPTSGHADRAGAGRRHGRDQRRDGHHSGRKDRIIVLAEDDLLIRPGAGAGRHHGGRHRHGARPGAGFRADAAVRVERPGRPHPRAAGCLRRAGLGHRRRRARAAGRRDGGGAGQPHHGLQAVRADQPGRPGAVGPGDLPTHDRALRRHHRHRPRRRPDPDDAAAPARHRGRRWATRTPS